MLQYQTVDSRALDLLKKISSQPAFLKHRLVGGTSLASPSLKFSKALLGILTTDKHASLLQAGKKAF
jgi:hypothetical protein